MLPLHGSNKDIKKILEKTGRMDQAAQALGIDRKTLYRKLGEIEEAKTHE
jgi:transcriptional regulator of acetoin/glycerol metabolism